MWSRMTWGGKIYHTRGLLVPQDGTLTGKDICGLLSNTVQKTVWKLNITR